MNAHLALTHRDEQVAAEEAFHQLLLEEGEIDEVSVAPLLSANPDKYPDIATVREQARGLISLTSFDLTEAATYSELQESGEWANILDMEAPEALETIETKLRAILAKKIADGLSLTETVSEALDTVLNGRNWGKFQAGTAERKVGYGIYAKLTSLRGALYNKYLEEAEIEQKLSPVCKLEIEHFAEIADAMIAFFIKWDDQDARLLDNAGRLEAGFKNRVAIIGLDDDGQAVEIPWAQAFPDEVSRLTSAYDALVNKLSREASQHTEEPLAGVFKAKIAFYKALADAWREPTPQNWHKVDCLLGRQTNGVPTEAVHVHASETLSRDRISLYPDVCLQLPDPRMAQANQTIEETRNRLIEMVAKFLSSTSLSNAAKDSQDLLKTAACSARMLINGGGREMFGYGGQILPNDISARIAGGMDISIGTADPAIVEAQKGAFNKSFKIAFGRDATPGAWNSLGGRFDSAHEFSHVLGLVPGMLDRIDDSFIKAFAEEWKADTGAIIFDTFMPVEAGQPGTSIDDLRDIIEYRLGFLLQLRRKWGWYEGYHSYIRSGIMLVNLLEEQGLLVKTQDETHSWQLQLDNEEKLLSFYRSLRGQFEELLEIYDEGKNGDLGAWLRSKLKAGEAATALFAKVDADDEIKDKSKFPSLEKMCEIPSNGALAH